MAFPNDVTHADDCCDICGARLGDEAVTRQLPDGSQARLCSECATGAIFGQESNAMRSSPAPNLHSDQSMSGSTADLDPMEMTKELLTPVADLISLQGEMQVALERLAGSLERFAAEVITDSMGKTATVETRLKNLETELEKTRSRLREAESLLVGAAGVVTGDLARTQTTAGMDTLPAGTTVVEVPPSVFGPEATVIPPLWEAGLAATEPPGGATGPTATPLRSADGSPAGVFSLEDIRAAQRYFNESAFIERVRDVRHSLGKPRANLSRLAGTELRALVTIWWDIVWYQYLVDLRRDIPAKDRVSLFREGMDLEELNACFTQKNASIDDDGRLDASELEVLSLDDPTVLITEMTPDEERALEDATEEIWDQHIAPEFKWDD